jgi:hypothetical protein
VRSLASRYSSVVCINLILMELNLDDSRCLRDDIHTILDIFLNLDVFRVEMQMHWLFILGKIRPVAHLSKVFLVLQF